VPRIREPNRTAAAREELLQKVLLLRDKSAQSRLFAAHPELLHSETVVRLSDASRDQAKIDTVRALQLAELAMDVAGKLKDRAARARGFRAMGNALYVSGQNEAAIRYHENASRLFARVGGRKEVARTLSASIQPLILTGRYDRAFTNAKRAQRIFSSLKDDWRLARLDLNTGNIFHRQDRFAEALKWYRRAHRYFFIDPEKDPEAMGVALHNIAMCLVSLNDFHGALAAHEEARSFAEKHGMHLLVAQTDYNIAALHYLRGEHSRAIRMLLSTLEDCRKTSDRYHAALCRLDLSDIYLRLNLAGPADEMAREAAADFEKLGMGYETGKALVNLALAISRQNGYATALKILTKARRTFAKEKNLAWPVLTDLYGAIIMTAQGRVQEAWTRALAANKFFVTSQLPDKLVLSNLLLARLQLLIGNVTRAGQLCSLALAVLKQTELPALACQAQQLMGRIEMAAGRTEQAYESYQEARRLLEAMRNDLRQDEMKISFMEDKLEIYEGLAHLCLDPKSTHHDPEQALQYIEQAKSRSLQDLMSFAWIESSSAQESGAQTEAKRLRGEINWFSHRLAEEQLRAAKSSPKLRNDLQAGIRTREKQLLRLSREMSTLEAEYAGLSLSRPATLASIRDSLPPDALLLEYFQIQDKLLAAILTRDSLSILPVSQLGTVTALVEHLEFQLSKFRLGAEYVSMFGDTLLKTVQHHLHALYDALLSPIDGQLQKEHLVIVPHGVLHRLPFQALFDGERYLIDKFRISYAPSGTIHALCHDRPNNSDGPALVMGVHDAAAPLIRDEAIALAGIIPKAELLLDDDATAAALRSKGAHCRLIHIATHGYYRQDSPMFSGIRLSDSTLSLYDLYRFKLPVELITLSGCVTGLSTVAGGDELLGLIRGLIFAGARAALLTLWDVQDRSTLEFMVSFYRYLNDGEVKAAALRKAVLDLRQRYPHPYHWAPFSLIGNVFNGY
jgi:CHAT domain-containing protein